MNPTNSAQALSQLQSTQSGAQSAADILNNQKNQFGVQGAQDTVSGLRGAITNTTKLLNQVAPSVMGRTGQSLVTSAQANRQIQNEQQPLAQNLSQQSQEYNTANEDYNKALQNASQAADSQYQDQQNKLSYAQNLYNTLFSREQSAKEAAAQKAQQAEATRQFNEQLKFNREQAAKQNASNGSSGLDLSSLLNGMNGASKSAVSQQRKDKGFNFQSSSGSPISAGTYARLTGRSWQGLLTEMANSGDVGAKDVLKNGSKSKYWGNLTWGS